MDKNESDMAGNSEPLTPQCPYVGLVDDPTTSLGYPSVWNYCHRAKPLAVAHADQQRVYCLTTKHTECPLFLKSENSPMPAEMQTQDVRTGRNTRVMWQTVAAIGMLVIVVAVAVWQGFARGFFNLPTQFINKSVATATATSIFVPSPTMPVATLSPTAVSNTPETPNPNPTVVSTNTPLPTLTPQATLQLDLETPLGYQGLFLIHQMAEGESLDRLAQKYSTTVALIQAINYYVPSPLLVNWKIIIPMGKIDIQGVPSFEPLMVVGSMTVDDFAKSLSVDANTLSYYNGLTTTYRLSPGDWLLIPRKKRVTAVPSPTATP